MEYRVIKSFNGCFKVNLIVNYKAYTLDRIFNQEIDAYEYGNILIQDLCEGNNANTVLYVRCLLDDLKLKQTENKGGGMRPIDYDVNCVTRTLEMLSKGNDR